MCGNCNNKKCCAAETMYKGPTIDCLGIDCTTSHDEAIQILGETICEEILNEEIIPFSAVFTQSTGDPSTIPNQPGETDTYTLYQDAEQTDIVGNFTVYNGVDGIRIIEVTYAEAIVLHNESEFIPGMIYHITDRDYYFVSLDNGSLPTTGWRVQTILHEEAYEIVGSRLGVFRSTLTPDADDQVFWGGKFWINTSGSVGTAVNETELSSDWEISTTYNISKVFEIKYDLINDWITVQEDDKGNRIGIAYNNQASFNPVDITDWGNPKITKNNVYGIYNNGGSVLISENSNKGLITENANSVLFIFGNSNNGNISENIGGMSIGFNRNIGNITQNDSGTISNNSCVGSIFENTCGSILDNSNLGNIRENGSVGDILRNTNLGEISYNNNTGDITENSSQGRITYNTCLNISNNSNQGFIDANTHNGGIQRNSNRGNINRNSSNALTTFTIRFNNNNGSISFNNSTANIIIESNVNNGIIGNVSAAVNRAIDITDTILDK
jgi:hypothetical protein